MPTCTTVHMPCRRSRCIKYTETTTNNNDGQSHTFVQEFQQWVHFPPLVAGSRCEKGHANIQYSGMASEATDSRLAMSVASSMAHKQLDDSKVGTTLVGYINPPSGLGK